MKGKIVVYILLGIVILAVVLLIVTPVIVEPVLRKKVLVALNEKLTNHHVEIEKVHFSLVQSAIEFENIILTSNHQNEGNNDLTGEIESVKFKGISLLKALFKKDFDIDEVIISNATIQGKVSFPKNKKPPAISHSNIRIDNILVDRVNLALKDSSTSKALAVKNGILNLYNIQIEKQDTLQGFLRKFDFGADEFLSVSADSMYTLKASGINYSDSSKNLSLNGFSVLPNYKDYDFTSRHRFETDRVEGVFSNIYMYNFPVDEYFNSGSLISTYIEIGELDLRVFRDKRKDFEHVNKPTLQDLIYNYPGALRIDSIAVLRANIIYSEHVEKATEPGMISMNELQAKIYSITNDTIYKTKKNSFKLRANALLMGKGRMTVALNAELFDKQNTFSMTGSLSNIEAKELNPMLEKNAFVYATSGKIEKMNFSFTANNTKATGQMTMIYNGLDLAIKNKRTDDTTAIIERIVSIIANKKALNSNPLPGDSVRIGIIDYKRDPEKFIFNYGFKSILSGIKSSVIKNPKEKREKKTLIQKVFGKPDDK